MKKETKKSTKKAKYVVDLTNAVTPEDVKFEFIKAKCLAGVKITEDEFKFMLMCGANLALDALEEYIEQRIAEEKRVVIQDDKLVQEMLKLIMKHTQKKPWYKRFWAWIKNPFKKNK